MSVNRKSRKAKIWILVLVGVLTGVYSLLGLGGVLVYSGRMRGAEYILILGPVLAWPLFCTALLSIRLAGILLTVDFLLLHATYAIINWPHFKVLAYGLVLDWPIALSAALLIWLASSHGRVPQVSL